MAAFLWAGEECLSTILSLWKQGFPEDTEEDIRDFWYTLREDARCLMMTENDEARSMAFVIPAIMNDTVVWYVYAAVTACEYRGQGCFSALLRELACRAEKEQVGGLFLRPASSSLFDYYTRLGFVSLFYTEETACEANCLYNDSADWHWEEITEGYDTRRQQWLERLGVPSITWSQNVTAYAVNLLKSGGMLVSHKGLAMYQRDGDGIEITELLCAAEEVDVALSSLSRHFACRITRVSYPPFATECAQKYGMFYAVGDTEVSPDMWYMGFSLE